MGCLVPGLYCHPPGLLWLVEWETLPLRTGSAREGRPGYLLFRGLLVNKKKKRFAKTGSWKPWAGWNADVDEPFAMLLPRK